MKIATALSLFLALVLFAACSKNDAANVPAPELTSILQTSIDAPQLQAFYHENEVSDRKPLRIALNQSSANEIHLKKFNMPVIITTANKCAQDQACLIIREIKIDNISAKVSFAYPIEGVQGIMELQQKNSKWTLVNANIVEH